jgi:NAD(P)-dependent dehydrogenase (short-subunit alcohol dehydrogenase family)
MKTQHRTNGTSASDRSGRVWLITGATSGFGRAIAEAALAAGDTVVAAARKPEALDDLGSANDRLSTVKLDVTDPAQIPGAVDEVVGRHGRLDVLVNNAGRGLVGAVEETTDAELRDLMDLHFFGPAALTRAVLPQLRAQGSGAIVQLTSQGGRLAFPGVGGYCATKFALEGLTEALAGEVQPFGITTMIVEPGAFRTGFNKPGSLQASEPMPEYEDTVGPARKLLAERDGEQPGDPARAAAAILEALDAEHPPLRLVLGSDAVEMVGDHLDELRSEFDEWRELSSSTDVADAGAHAAS